MLPTQVTHTPSTHFSCASVCILWAPQLRNSLGAASAQHTSDTLSIAIELRHGCATPFSAILTAPARSRNAADGQSPVSSGLQTGPAMPNSAANALQHGNTNHPSVVNRPKHGLETPFSAIPTAPARSHNTTDGQFPISSRLQTGPVMPNPVPRSTAWPSQLSPRR